MLDTEQLDRVGKAAAEAAERAVPRRQAPTANISADRGAIVITG